PSRFDEALLGLPADGGHILNDDRIGRCLDALFMADRAAMLTEIVVHAVRAFDVDLSELHNDSTTVTFTGQYLGARGGAVKGRPTHRITFGYNKDHRPDLKQLLWVLTTSADGAVPVWCSIDHGNTTDDQTHIQTWETLRRVVGTVDFLYVADSKLCTKENMEHIARPHGRFLTVLPKTRREDTSFRDWLQTHEATWVELVRKKNSRRQEGPDEVYRGFESPLRSVEGYRILWIWSSQKHEKDRAIRQDRIQRASHELEQLRVRVSSPKSRLKTQQKIENAATAILTETQADRWIKTTVEVVEEHHYNQAAAGRPSASTKYVRKTKQRLDLHWESKADALKYDDRTDGIFPLILNDEKLSVRDALLAYKRQPALEKRHEQMKTVFDVMPVNLKSPSRIEALFFIYFLALLVESLIEREIRRTMKVEKIAALPLYHEGRQCKAPTANRLFDVFHDIRRHRLVGANDTIHRNFYDKLSELQRTLLRLLGQSPAAYFSAGDKGEAGGA
ncbi:MAG TPA: IS1634 family transposase, partial [Thermoleophilia bacterium]|nr:IS1634 family transposase [Thermoleophilia bacterium]